jgi:hypothetical protein
MPEVVVETMIGMLELLIENRIEAKKRQAQEFFRLQPILTQTESEQ